VEKRKAFHLTALLTLGVCHRREHAIFTVLRTVVLEPLAFAAPDAWCRCLTSIPAFR